MNKFIGTALIAVGLAAVAYSAERMHKEELQQHARNLERKANNALDIQAINNAAAIIQRRIALGELQYMAEVNRAFDEQLEFEKIAVRL